MAAFDRDLHGGGDDWHERVLRSIRESFQQREAQQGQIEIAFQNGLEYLAEQQQEHEWLVENFIQRGSLVILGGNSKSGKTCLATALAMAVVKAEPFLGHQTTKAPILWCAYEESRQERLTILRQFGNLPEHFYTSHPRFKIDSDLGQRTLGAWTGRLSHPPLIVIDPLFGATDVNLSEGRAARRALMGLKRLAAETGAVVLVIHHVNKDTSAGLIRERFAESNQILATASMDILMDSRDRPDGSREIRLQCCGRGDHANQTLLVRSTGPADFQLLSNAQPGVTKGVLRTDAILNTLRTSESPLTTEELSARCGLKLGSMRNLLTQLVADGQIQVTGRQGKSRLFALPT